MKKLIGLLAVICILSAGQAFAEKTYSIGETGPAGGIIVAGFKILGTPRYIEASKQDLPSNYTWEQAMDACKNLEENGFDNWVLPTKEVLHLMYENLYLNGNKGGFTLFGYWSSSDNGDYAWTQYFTTGDPESYNYKDYPNATARCVRAI